MSHRIIAAHPEQVQAVHRPRRVRGEPPARPRLAVPVPVVVQPRRVTLLPRVAEGSVVRLRRAARRQDGRPPVRVVLLHADDPAVTVHLQPAAPRQVIVAVAHLVVADAVRPA